MAYQFFAKAQQSKTPAATTSPPPLISSSHGPYNSRQNRPSIHPPPVVLPQSSSTSKFKPPTSGDSTFQPAPYPHSIASGYPTPHPHISIEPVSTAHIQSLTRITGLLLPIRYPNSFYTATITDPVIASLSRVAIYHDHPVAAAPAPGSVTAASKPKPSGTDKVIGGIRCRLERLPQSPELSSTPITRAYREPTNLYIQTLHLLSPYRGNGVAASLLNSILFSSPSSSPGSKVSPTSYQVSELVKHYNIRTVTAHVHEANEEGLTWYIARGFQVEDGVVQGYYRRLKPSGAKIVKLILQWDHDEDGQVPATTRNTESGDDTLSNQDKKFKDSAKTTQHDDNDDDDWEKVEAEDEEDLGVQPFNEAEDGNLSGIIGRKRKADDNNNEEPRL